MSEPITASITGAAAVDAGDGVEQLNRARERGAQLLDVRGERRDRLVEEVDLGEHLRDEQRMVVGDAADECLAQRGQLAPQFALRELGQQLRVVRAREQRVEHRATRRAEHLRGDRGELDPRVLEHLLQALRLARTLLDLRLAIPRQVAQLADRLRRYEARPHKPVLEQPADPHRIGDIGLAAGDVTQMLRVQKPALELTLEQIEDGFPVDAGRLHPHQRDREATKPVRQRDQPRSRCRERSCLLLTIATSIRHAHARRQRILVHIERRAALQQPFHLKLPSVDRSRRRPGGASQQRV
jgi:hypothetical protein